MNKYVNPPCNSSLATSFVLQKKEFNPEEAAGIPSLFGGSVAGDERELAIDEVLAASSSVPSFHFVPDSNVNVRKGEEFVRRTLEEVEARAVRAEEASEGNSFVDIKGGLEKETGGESEEFKFSDILQRADFL